MSDDRHAQIVAGLHDKPYVPIVTPSNIQRLSFINAVTKSTPLSTDHYPVRLVARLSESRSETSAEPSILTTSIIARFMTMPDSELARLPAFIDCIIGMPVMVTHNVCKQDGIVNGTVGILHSMTFPDGTRFAKFHDRDMDTSVLVPENQAEFLVVELPNPRHVPLPGLERNYTLLLRSETISI